MIPHSKEARPTLGTTAQAMAYRAKYRKQNADGRPLKVIIRIENMGVHRQNRGGVYPGGRRCVSLCEESCTSGFVKEEFSHAVVVVEEKPIEEVLRSRGPVQPLARDEHQSAAAYNIAKSSQDDLLATCFQAPYNDVRVSLLSHNHMMLVLRAFLTQAKWDIPAAAEKDLVFCDAEGRLSISALAASPHGKELQEVLQEGVLCEVLSWKMDDEEPHAASIISQALNQPQDAAMRTTELTAVAVLRGAIIAEAGPGLANQVAFQTVRDRVRTELHTAVDDPDLPEIFDLLINSGVGHNTYVEEFLEWTRLFVDSKKRQLRFSAFAAPNKMPDAGQNSRFAVLKRAYRKSPTNGYCPCPEAAWADTKWDLVKYMEDLLRFYHVICRPKLLQKTPQARIKFLGNIDIAAADAFIAVVQDKKLKGQKLHEKVMQALLKETNKYFLELGLNDPDEIEKLPNRNVPGWIIRPATPATPATQAAVETSEPTSGPIGPRIITFDAASGHRLNSQVQFTAPAAAAAAGRQQARPAVRVPWRTWLTDQSEDSGQVLGCHEADMAAATAILHCLHAQLRLDQEPVEVWKSPEGPSQVYVTALWKCKAEVIQLPACIPLQSKLHRRTDHPFAAEITIRVMKNHWPRGMHAGQEEEEEQQATTVKQREVALFALPEFKAPKREEGNDGASSGAAAAETKKKEDAAAAGTQSPGDPSVTSNPALPSDPTLPPYMCDENWNWEDGPYTMHPFWAVRRLTDKQLARAVAEHEERPKGTTKPRFNCSIVRHSLSNVSTGMCPNDNYVNTVRIIEVPFLTNFLAVEDGEELIMQVGEKKETPRARDRTWRDAYKDEEAQAKKRDHERLQQKLEEARKRRNVG